MQTERDGRGERVVNRGYEPWANRVSSAIDAVIQAPGRCVLLCIAFIVLEQFLMNGVSMPYVLQAVLDEPAHLATTVILLLALLRTVSRTFTVAALVATVLIDLDHIPMYFGYAALTPATHRPYTHSLATVAVAAFLALVLSRRRAIFSGIAFGVTGHLFRDIATNYVPLFWPLTLRETLIPWWVHLTILIPLSGFVLLRSLRPHRTGYNAWPSAGPGASNASHRRQEPQTRSIPSHE
jgi:inner membrane protein